MCQCVPLLFLDGFRFISSSAVKPYFMGFLALFIYRLLLSEFVTFSKIGVKIGVVREGMSISLPTGNCGAIRDL